MNRKHRFRSEINYLQQHKKRQRLTHYLRGTNFRKIAGSRLYTRIAARNRKILIAVALVILVIGMVYVII